MSLHDELAHCFMALHDTKLVDCLALGDTPSPSVIREIGDRWSPQLVAGNRHRTNDVIWSISLASSVPPSACVLFVAAPTVDVP